jgi:carbon monoxide dehydrogenase subunit G
VCCGEGVRIQDEFEVQAPIDRVWAYLLDVQKIAPCAPGAELTEVVDDHTWKGKVNVKVGPVAMSFAGTVVMQQRDDQAHVVVLKAEGREQRGKGAASALVQSRLEAVDGGTKVSIDTDLTISGAVAQYGRGMVGDISQRLTKEFADCLQAKITGDEPTQAEEPTTSGPEPALRTPAVAPLQSSAGSSSEVTPRAQGRPVKGLRLALWAAWRAVVRALMRPFGPRQD